jgi:hypothetical protein
VTAFLDHSLGKGEILSSILSDSTIDGHDERHGSGGAMTWCEAQFADFNEKVKLDATRLGAWKMH